jgi:hypothetical protein
MEDEAAIDHRPVDKMFTTSPNTEREPPGGRGADDQPTTTKHDRAAVDTGSAAVGVTPNASRITRPSPGCRSPRQGNHARHVAETIARGRQPVSFHGPHHADPWPTLLPAGGHCRRSIASSAHAMQEGDLPPPEHHGLCLHARAGGSSREDGDRSRGGRGGSGVRVLPEPIRHIDNRNGLVHLDR